MSKKNTNKIFQILILLLILIAFFAIKYISREYLPTDVDEVAVSIDTNANKEVTNSLEEYNLLYRSYASIQPLGMPLEMKGQRVYFVDHHIFQLGNNAITKFADWVAYRITKDQIAKRYEVRRNWKADPMLDPAETLEPSDYDNISNMDCDRGHQAPLASFTGVKNWRVANYMSNITPQPGSFNKGTWKALEKIERALVKNGVFDTLYVVTGPYYNDYKVDVLPHSDEDLVIPDGYWKIIYTIQGKKVYAEAFIFPRETEKGTDFLTKNTTVDSVEVKSGYEFFTKLDDDQEDRLESQYGGKLAKSIRELRD